jgi:hypothetical protein
MNNGIFGLRYAGQQVADLRVSKGEVKISTKDYDTNNKRDFDCEVQADNALWDSKEASKFRKHFKDAPIRSDRENKRNEEHRVESMLLGEFSKKSGKNKLLLGIQPVRLFGGRLRFQLPTPLTASGKEVKYSNSSGGGIDILCRIGRGTKTKLCVMEVKDENISKEPPSKAVGQAIAYAVFLRELLRSKSGNDWYKIFGFHQDVPKKLKLVACIAMPCNPKSVSDFEGKEIQLEDDDKLVLHSIYFEEKERKLDRLRVSFFGNDFHETNRP